MEQLLSPDFKFIDLFAGIGGFHQAMTRFGGKCVYAAEINPETAKTYTNNYHLEALHDITKIDPNDIPQHEVLCAGFPCQSFSKAGQQKGFGDVRGVLFFDIVRILKNHIQRYGGPKFLVLENVRNLVSHDHGKTWIRIRKELEDIGYNVVRDPIIVSPHYFGIPQLRERVVIVAVRKEIYDKPIKLTIPRVPKNSCSMDSVLIQRDTKEYKLASFKLDDYEERLLAMWDDFIHGINRKIIGFPIWSDVFFSKRPINSKMPEWKQEFVRKNQELYRENKEFIDSWYKKYDQLSWVKKTHRKFEWQVDNKITSVFEGIIQFRPSGIRVKQPTEFPALVAMVHVPIIGKYHRYLTPREAANLQSFPPSFQIDENMRLAYKQFGNAVNVDVIANVFQQFIKLIEEQKNG
ncbi:MAG: DNA cytosine methyltransferase [Bacilli bacterium]|nr:DNA cytosine methyltransferase [Bacilli bacterium]